MDGTHLRVVLVRSRNSGNVGAVARALKTMGLAELVLAAPYRFDAGRAREMAVHATDVLERARIVPTLDAAIADCGLVVGTTSRPTAARHGVLAPRALAAEIGAVVSRQPVALVFGPEHHGLSNDELGRCHRVVTIPTSAAYRSLNVAQAVLVCVYELFVATTEEPVIPASPRATSQQVEFMYARLEDGLRAIGFLHDGNARHMMEAVRGLLAHARLDDHGIQLLLGIARQMAWAGARRGAPAAGASA